MKELAERILTEAQVFDGGMVRVDKFLNHQVDINLLKRISREFAKHFANFKPTKVITVEASGIIPAVFTADALDVPLVFAKKASPTVQNQNRHSSMVFSFTKNQDSQISVPKYLLDPEDRLLIIDDFLARGNTLSGLLDISKSADATVIGTGIVIAKLFQGASGLITDPRLNVLPLIAVEEMSATNFTMKSSDGVRYFCKVTKDGKLVLEKTTKVPQGINLNG